MSLLSAVIWNYSINYSLKIAITTSSIEEQKERKNLWFRRSTFWPHLYYPLLACMIQAEMLLPYASISPSLWIHRIWWIWKAQRRYKFLESDIGYPILGFSSKLLESESSLNLILLITDYLSVLVPAPGQKGNLLQVISFALVITVLVTAT